MAKRKVLSTDHPDYPEFTPQPRREPADDAGDGLRQSLRQFVSTLGLTSRAQHRQLQMEHREIGAQICFATLTAALAIGLGKQQDNLIEHLFKRLLRTKAASVERRDTVKALQSMLLEAPTALRRLQVIPGYNWEAALRMMDLTRRLVADPAGGGPLAELCMFTSTTLQLVSRFHLLETLRKRRPEAVPIRIAVFEEFGDYFSATAGFIAACVELLGLNLNISVTSLPYHRLYELARNPDSGYDLLLIDDPWLAEFLDRRLVRPAPRPFSAHVMHLCVNKRRIADVASMLGGLDAHGISADHLAALAAARPDGQLLHRPRLVYATKNPQNLFTFAAQIHHAGAPGAVPSQAELADALQRVTRGTAPEPLSPDEVIRRIAGAQEFAVGPVFLGSAVLSTPYLPDLIFLPFQGGGVRGYWHLATAAKSASPIAEVVSEILASPVDRTMQLLYGIAPADFGANSLHGQAENQVASEKVAAITALLSGKSFSRFSQPASFLEAVGAFNRRVGR